MSVRERCEKEEKDDVEGEMRQSNEWKTTFVMQTKTKQENCASAHIIMLLIQSLSAPF
jgi:hypothetical protein